MKTVAVRFSALLLIILGCACTTFAWGPATHTYITSSIVQNASNNVLWGAIAPDVNQALSPAPTSVYFMDTHYGVMNIYNAAATPEEREFAFGFVSHNEDWAADYTAHFHSRMTPRNEGYVIRKSQQLCSLMTMQLTQAGLTQYLPYITLDNCHFVLEWGVDRLVLKQHPELAAKLFNGAALHSVNSGALLEQAFGPVLPDAKSPSWAAADALWAQTMATYGAISQMPDEQAIPALATLLTMMAENLGIIPPGDPAFEAAFGQLVQLGLVDSMQICAEDSGPEIAATIQFVNKNMENRKIEF